MSEPAVTDTDLPINPLVYTLSIGAPGVETEVHVFTTQAARRAALIEYVTDSWAEYLDDDLPTDLDVAVERFHRETDHTWELNEGPLEGPPTGPVAVIALIRTMLMGTWDNGADFLDTISILCFRFSGLPPAQDIRRADGRTANWDIIGEAWEALVELHPDVMPTPAAIQAYLVGDGNPFAQEENWGMAHCDEAARQGWTLYKDPAGTLSIQRYSDVFDSDAEAMRYVERQAKREQPAAVEALELIDRTTRKEPHARITGSKVL